MSGRGRAVRLRAQLGERDVAVLDSLAKLRLLTGKQVQRLHVADGSPTTQARRTRALLQRLTDLHLVVRLTRRVGGIRAGSEGYLYGLSGLGQAVLGVGGPLNRRRRSVWETKPWFQDHVLAVAELAVELTTRTRVGPAELLAFNAEPACWRRFTGPGGQLITLKPDAVVRIGLGEYEQQAFIEMDLGTESLPTIERKCRRYVAYWHTGQQQAHGVFPRVWWLTSTEQRQAGIAAVVRHLAQDAQALFTVVLSSEAAEQLTHWPTAGAPS
jgi:hypothetical protein